MKRYRVIYADPPWQLETGPPSLHDKGQRTRALPYPTMSLEQICALPVSDLAMDDAVLFLWTTNKYLEASYRVARAWGFDPSTMLVWIKPPKGRGLGGTFGISTEFLLFSRRGTVAARERYPSTWFDSKRGLHSRKPGFARELIDRCFDGPKIELFAREAFLGWDAWGNQIISDVSLRMGSKG